MNIDLYEMNINQTLSKIYINVSKQTSEFLLKLCSVHNNWQKI
jgi:hypothetical protein